MFAVIFPILFSICAGAQNADNLPPSISTGPWKEGHVQGVAVDTQRGYAYFSFTTMLVKTDLQGNVIGTVKGLLGHLGCLDLNPDDGRIYGSLEYKNDAIGKGILNRKGVNGTIENAFYVAIFDTERIVRTDMDAERDSVMTTVFLPTVLDDYTADVETGGRSVKHRYGCSGIDGISFGPEFGKKNGRNMLIVAYGIYGDTTRTDNDYQILLQYDTKLWKKYETPLSQNNMHSNGPKQPRNRYFVYTGNTTYGIQNLEYDSHSGGWFMAAYKGRKCRFPNYSVFIADGNAKPKKQNLNGIEYSPKGKVVPLAEYGAQHCPSGVRGYNFPLGATGMHSLGNGLFYLSKNSSGKKGQSCTLTLFRFTGKTDKPFEAVK